MVDLKLNIDGVTDIASTEEIKLFENETSLHLEKITQKSGKGNDFLGWVDLPCEISNDFIEKLKEDAERIAQNSEVLVVAGIGGSYLGARAVIDALDCHFATKSENNKYPKVVYAGHNIAEDYIYELLQFLDDKNYSIVVISKSGTTTETAIAFRLLKSHIENKYGKEKAKNRIFAITDSSKGALRKLAETEGYTTYSIPDDVGGRFSVFTPVGLLPIAAAGCDIKQLIEGAVNMRSHLLNTKEFFDNPAFLYAATRNVLYNKGKIVEILAHYLPDIFYIAEWWKQLFGESEGKDNKGIMPMGVNFTTDLHSMGQYIQEGKRIIFETALCIENNKNTIEIAEDPDDFDGLNYLAGKSLGFVNAMAEKGTSMAHKEGGVPVIKLSMPQLNERNIGELFYFFQMSCAISGYMLEANPFDQPGVEAYKKNMFALLGKPGYENLADKLK